MICSGCDFFFSFSGWLIPKTVCVVSFPPPMLFFFSSLFLKRRLSPCLPLVANSVGQVLPSNQSNNLYVFPGLALGAKLCQAKLVSTAFAPPTPGDLCCCLIVAIASADLATQPITSRQVCSQFRSPLYDTYLKEHSFLRCSIFCLFCTLKW